MTTLAFIQNLSTMELLIILGIALLLFGRRLPEVGKSLGKGIVEFKKGLAGIEDQVTREEKRELPTERAYRAPLAEGEDRRVSRVDRVEEESTPRTQP
jgi:TatA/E family protein of Tat protein translocase